MTRADIENTYDVNASSGLITSPGKFEGESVVVPYFYAMWGNGFASEDFGSVRGIRFVTAFFKVEDSDRVEFGNELFGIYGLALEETDQGFVYCTTCDTEQEYKDLVERAEAAESELLE